MRGTSYEGVPIATPTRSGRKRVALVIGNSKYPNAPLRNPRNDAQAFGAKLEAVEPAFDVTTALDVGRDEMEDALETFEAKLADCDTGLLFFAGHGLQVKGTNFLMPIDADIRQEIHLRRRAFSLDEVLDIMGRRVKHSSLVFLDACRENPFARSLLAGMPQEERGRFLTRSGLAEVRADTGTFIAFATAPNNVALDGTSENSPFTASLLEHMATPNASINDVMIAVRRDVLKATRGRQEPWDQSSLRERFCFSEQTNPETAQSPQISVELPREASIPFDQTTLLERAAIEHWEAIKGSSDPAQFRAFLADYGTTRMAPLASVAMQRLATSAWTSTQPPGAQPRREAMIAGASAETQVSTLLTLMMILLAGSAVLMGFWVRSGALDKVALLAGASAVAIVMLSVVATQRGLRTRNSAYAGLKVFNWSTFALYGWGAASLLAAYWPQLHNYRFTLAVCAAALAITVIIMLAQSRGAPWVLTTAQTLAAVQIVWLGLHVARQIGSANDVSGWFTDHPEANLHVLYLATGLTGIATSIIFLIASYVAMSGTPPRTAA